LKFYFTVALKFLKTPFDVAVGAWHSNFCHGFNNPLGTFSKK